MNDFQWLGNDAILYKGRVCQITEDDGWGVVNAMKRVDREEREKEERLRAKIKAEIMAELKKKSEEEE